MGRTQGTLKVKRGEWNLGPKGKCWWLLGSRTEPGGEGGDTEAERSEVIAPPNWPPGSQPLPGPDWSKGTQWGRRQRKATPQVTFI